MVEVLIAPLARADLEAIDDYGIAMFGIEAAEMMSAGFRQAFEQLGRYPQSAPLRTDYGDGIRCKIHRGYRVLYRFDEVAVLIVRVLHHSRDIPTEPAP